MASTPTGSSFCFNVQTCHQKADKRSKLKHFNPDNHQGFPPFNQNGFAVASTFSAKLRRLPRKQTKSPIAASSQKKNELAQDLAFTHIRGHGRIAAQ